MEQAAYEEMAQIQDHHWWFVARRQILSSVISNLPLPKPARILEVGAGTGGNLPMLSEFGKVHAVELDAYARAFASQRVSGVDVREGKLPDGMPFSKHSFDFVCMFDVLEHIEQDTASLETLRDLCAPGGFALITVPANRWLFSQHDVRLHHVRRYTRSELKSKATQTGWKIRRLTFFNSLLFPLAVAARLADKIRKNEAPSGTGIPTAPVNASLQAIFATERGLLRMTNLPFGVSLLAVLEAPGATS